MDMDTCKFACKAYFTILIGGRMDKIEFYLYEMLSIFLYFVSKAILTS